MGSLCQTAVRRTSTSAEVPGALYPSGSYFEPASNLAGGRPGDFPVEELCARKRASRHDVEARGVHPTLPAACFAQRLCEDPSLRVSGQPLPARQCALMPRTAGVEINYTAGTRAA